MPGTDAQAAVPVRKPGRMNGMAAPDAKACWKSKGMLTDINFN
jgi:hypothetical protein